MKRKHAILVLSLAFLVATTAAQATVGFFNAPDAKQAVKADASAFNTKSFEFTANELGCWYVNQPSTSKRYALAFRLPDDVSDYDGSYVDIRDDSVLDLNIWNNQISFMLSDGTEEAFVPQDAQRTRIIITNDRRFQIDFLLPGDYDLGSIVGVRIKSGTHIPTLAFAKKTATSKYAADTVLVTARDAVFSVSPNPSYSPTTPGSNPWVFSDYTGYAKTNVDLDGLGGTYSILKNGSQSNRYRLYMRFPTEGLDFHAIDPTIVDGRVENTYVASLNWKRQHIYFDDRDAKCQENHEGWISFAKSDELAQISLDLNCNLSGVKTLTILEGTELPSLAFATGVTNEFNNDVTKVFTFEKTVTLELTPNPGYTGNSGSVPYFISAPIDLEAKKQEAIDELEAINVDDYREEDQSTILAIIQQGIGKIQFATSVVEIKQYLDEAKQHLSEYHTKKYWEDLAAANEVIALIDAIGEVTVDSGELIAVARAAYDALNKEAKELVGPVKYKVLTDAEKTYIDIVETAAVNDVIEKIRSIGEVTLAKAEAIAKAREAYDALSEYGKSRIPAEDLATLEAAEAKIKTIKEARESALVVEDKIWNIGEISLESELAIVSAREAYDALNDLAKSYVSVEALESLLAAENTLQALKEDQKNQDAANDVIDLINAIGKVDINSEEAIKNARSAYDALSDEAKAKISAETLKLLTDAEAKLQDIKDGKGQSVNPGLIIGIAGGALLLAGGAAALIIVRKKKKQK
ncbi:MAG: hypothetical protein MJ239_04045 [Bacilli bacterium]|nr:hypothetical protein [Bacilli bacterium]